MEQWEELFAAIHARLEWAVTTGDFTPVLEPGVLEEARRLAELASSDRANMEIAHIGGWLHWARYHGAADDRDLNTAIDAFTRCFIARRQRPDQGTIARQGGRTGGGWSE